MTPPVPRQPPMGRWRFIRNLTSPLHQPAWWRPRRPARDEASLADGVTLLTCLADAGGALETAFADFNRFLRVNGIRRDGPYAVSLVQQRARDHEAFTLDVRPDSLSLSAGGVEGIRRGLVFIEDEMLRRGGPFLALGRIERQPFVRTRISRCVFGPINRPPRNRVELADDVDYYPEEYLNRLAHDGVNGLWLTADWKDVCRTSVIPEFGRDADRMSAKLRRTVEKCGRYGIRIYVFCIEPRAMPGDSPAFRRHPDLRGQHLYGDNWAVCTSSAIGRRYVEEATCFLFSRVPGLGGMIVISVGERGTHCCSSAVLDAPNACPRCSRRRPWEVLADTLSAMRVGMDRAAPQAELISWPYGQSILWGEELQRDAAGRTPRGVCLQHNFETGGVVRQLGVTRTLWDYWLSYVGPSDLFRDCARAAAARGNRVFAKLQVGCSHEVATAPCVPAPGRLFGKYRAMLDLGVSGAMHCWYFGGDPSVMTRAAGDLSFTPFPASEREFLLRLAARDWGADAPAVAAAWRHFDRAYSQYPHAVMVSYYGPMHDGPAWPLYLEPRDLPLAPTWKLEYPPSGDRIGEFITYSHPPGDVLTLFDRMARRWAEGVRILRRIEPRYSHRPERLREIGAAKALGLQFESGRNILEFYLLREHLPDGSPAERRRLLKRMRALVGQEARISRQLLALCQADSRLGFHSEAEGYKYWPAKLRWRVRQLEGLLREEFPRVERAARSDTPLWPEWTGDRPTGPVYVCRHLPQAPALDGRPMGGVWDGLDEAECLNRREVGGIDPSRPLDDRERHSRRTTWRAGWRGRHLYLGVLCREPDPESVRGDMDDRRRWRPDDDAVMLVVEPRRLWPPLRFIVNARGSRVELRLGAAPAYDWSAAGWRGDDVWSVTMRIPLAALGRAAASRPLRVDVARLRPMPSKAGAAAAFHWMPARPWRPRLSLDTHNPADLGWLLFDRGPAAH